ncbi:MAG: glutathione S-transferase [Solirubrobacterales bacterium]
MNDRLRIYGFRGSHPCEAVCAAADHKGIAYDFVTVPPAMHRLIMPLMFGGSRVPGAKFAKRKEQKTTNIFRLLDQIVPEPALFPEDPILRARVDEAERWGEGEIQDVGRRVVWAHLSRSPETVRAWTDGDPPGFARWLKKHLGPAMAQVAKFGNKASDENVRADLAALPESLDRIDGYIAAGTIGGEIPNAADFQILSTVGMLMNMLDLREAIMERPCGPRAMRLFPDYSGRVPAGLLPEEWFGSLRAPISSRA